MRSRTNWFRGLLCVKVPVRLAFVALLLLRFWNATIAAQTVRTKDEIARVVSIDKLSVQNGTISGEVRNHTAHTLRDVEILSRHTWLWDNEFQPGTNDPSATDIYKLPKEVTPKGSVPFSFSPSPPPKAPGGRFVTTVYIAGFTEVIPQQR